MDEPRLVLGRERLPDRQPPGERAEERRDDVEHEREDDPAPDDEPERVEDAAPVGAAPPDDDEREDERRQSDDAACAQPDRHTPSDRLHAARAFVDADPRDARVDLFEPLGDRRPRVRSTASARAASPIAARRGSSATSAADRVGERVRVVRRHGDGGLRAQHLAVAGDVGGDGRERARERAREHHAEALLAERRRDERLRAEQRLRQLVLAEEADDVDARRPGTRSRVSRRRTASGSAPATVSRRPGAPMDLGPGAEQDLQPLPRLLSPGEDDPVLAAAGRRRRRDEDAVRDHLVVAREPALCDCLRALGDRDAVVDAVDQEAPERPRPTSSSRGRRTRGTSRRAGTGRG